MLLMLEKLSAQTFLLSDLDPQSNTISNTIDVTPGLNMISMKSLIVWYLQY